VYIHLSNRICHDVHHHQMMFLIIISITATTSMILILVIVIIIALREGTEIDPFERISREFDSRPHDL